MVSMQNPAVAAATATAAGNASAPPPAQPPQHQRTRSSVFKSFMHRRNNSDGSALPPTQLIVPSRTDLPPSPLPSPQREMGFPNFSRPAALGEIQQNKMDGPSRSPSKQFQAPRSPSKNGIASTSLKPSVIREAERLARLAKEQDDPTASKPKKTKSSTNLTSFLSRPKSSKNLRKQEDEEEARTGRKEKENETPPASAAPIYAQFSSGALEKQTGTEFKGHAPTYANLNLSSTNIADTSRAKARPISYHGQYIASRDTHQSMDSKAATSSTKSSSSKIRRGLGVFASGFGSKNTATATENAEFNIDPKDIDKHLEAMLDRRNIPENQRYKMRNLADTIKMEFIRQDWAESKGINGARPDSPYSDADVAGVQEAEENKPKSRGRTFTLSKSNGKKSEPNSPVKKSKGEGTLGRHFRSRSTDSVASDRDRPSSTCSSAGSGILSKMKLQQGPSDYVGYLRKVRQPQAVEVGKLHKLRLLLRNETVAWTEEFIRQGGMQEIVGLLHRIMEVEWREEHEDALLHENLLCLKALCTTALALQYLHSIQGTLFPALLRMLFDPEKKGPSEFTTRSIITSVLFTYIASASLQDRPVRAKTILGHLHDPQPNEHERPVGFVMDMRRERPYRIWCKEATSVTKEVFWIFLHHLNVVYLPRDKEPKEKSRRSSMDSVTYMQTHFPNERPPVPAAPYVGGVEWDATNYLASHLDLLNAILACTPTAEQRNNLRDLFKISGWERCMGCSLRVCKEKFYPGVHDGLRTWVAAAAEDGWDVRDVRYGPPPESRSPAKKPASPKKKEDQAPPKLDMPKLDFAAGGAISPVVMRPSENWLS
ncbi:armadillo-type protein [Xylariomycetidae sp. FL0641]|nr:armadillo-type protein [Xylariomycetidae sp. FL0641]